MNEIIAQAVGLDASWIIGGLSSAFVVFATWVGRFLKQIWSDIKIMHSNQIETLEAVIGKQSASTKKIKEQTFEILTNTIAIKKIQEDNKYSLNEIHEKLAAL